MRDSIPDGRPSRAAAPTVRHIPAEMIDKATKNSASRRDSATIQPDNNRDIAGVPVVHIGRIIETELRRQERTVTWLSRKIHCDRRNIYDIFHRDNIDTNLLMRISYALGVDFFKIFSDAMQGVDTEGFTPPAS